MLRKRLAKEIQIWASLKHENVLPFLGYYIEGKKKLPNLVSEWMVNGSLLLYMLTFPRCSLRRAKWYDIYPKNQLITSHTDNIKLLGIASDLRTCMSKRSFTQT